MPRPNKAWEKKYGNKKKQTLLDIQDNIVTAVVKLACGESEAQGVLYQALKHTDVPIMRLLDIDDMQMYGQRIIKAYHEWAKNDYSTLVQGIMERDPSLLKFIASIEVHP